MGLVSFSGLIRQKILGERKKFINLRLLAEKYKIAFVSEFDPQDITQRSGVPFFIAGAFRELGHEVVPIGHFHNKRNLFMRIQNQILVLIFNKWLKGKFGFINNLWSREFLENYATQTEEKLAKIDYDFVFSPESSTIAYLNIEKPIVFWRDATFANLLNYYPEFSNIHPKSIREAHRSEREALKRTSLAVYTSEWAAESALQDYKADPRKIVVIERGANLQEQAFDIESTIQQKSKEPLKLLFIGANWKRKGGDVTFKTALYLNEHGTITELHAVGAKPEISEPWPSWFHYHGYLKKSDQTQFKLLDELYKKCHFFMMPSVAENFGIVYAEASYYAVPSIGLKTGGVGNAIKEGKSGWLFAPNDPIAKIATVILENYQNKSRYLALCRSTKETYLTHFSWKTNTEKLIKSFELIQEQMVISKN